MIAVVVILGIIGIVFGYTKDKISEIRKGGTDVTKGLEQQVLVLKDDINALKEKASSLEKDTISNKDVVIDLFEKTRKIPTKVDASNWNVLGDEKLSFSVSFPNTWEKVQSIVDPTSEQSETASEVVYLQPIGQPDFLNSVTIKSDYADFAELSLKEKMEIFQDLDLLDSSKFVNGQMLYFINLDKDNNEVPTIIILTDDNIYRATFNISNKKLSGYFGFRKDFESIAATFALVPKVIETE